MKLHNGSLPLAGMAVAILRPSRLTGAGLRINPQHANAVDPLHGVLDLNLVGLRVHTEGVAVAGLGFPRALLGDQRLEYDLCRFHITPPPRSWGLNENSTSR